MKKKILLILTIILLLVGCNKENKEKEEIEDKKINSDYSLNETFNIMEFEINVSDDIKVITHDNGTEIIKIPITIKNTGTEASKLSMFYYKFYNSQGEEIASNGSSFNDSLDYAEKLNSNESYVKYLYYPKGEYKNYYIEFNDTYKKYKVGIQI